MTKHDDSFYLEGIAEHILAIRSYLPESKQAFMDDSLIQDAVLMRVMALGEEISHLSEDFMSKYPGQNWHKIVGLRNRIAHGYFEVDQEVIWDTLTGGSLDELDDLSGR